MTADLLAAVQKYLNAGVPDEVVVAAMTPPVAALMMAMTVKQSGGRFSVDEWRAAVQKLHDAGVAWLANNHPEAFRKEEASAPGSEEPAT